MRRTRGRGRSTEGCSSPGWYAACLCDVFANVPSQNFVNECLVPDTAAARFLAKLIEHSRIESNRDEPARFVS